MEIVYTRDVLILNCLCIPESFDKTFNKKIYLKIFPLWIHNTHTQIKIGAFLYQKPVLNSDRRNQIIIFGTAKSINMYLMAKTPL